VKPGCVTPGSLTSDSRDYAITTREAKPQEIELVQKRAQNYLAQHPSSAAGVCLLAVEADSVFPSEVLDRSVLLQRSTKSSFLGPARTLVGHSEVAQTQVLFRIGMKSVIAKRATERYHPVLHPDVTINVFPYDRTLAD
jgi:hypothetical protein